MSVKPITPKVNFLVKSKFESKPLPASMICLFIIVHVVFALDFGFLQFESQSVKKLMKFFTLTQATVLFFIVTYLFFYAYPNTYSIWYFMDAMIYYIFVIIISFSKNSYHDFQNDLHAFDREIEVYSNFNVEYKIFVAFLLVLGFRCTLSASYCLYYVEYCVYPVQALSVYFVAMLGLNFVLITYAFLFQSVYYRMKNFTSFVKNVNTDVVSCHYLYKSLVEITVKAKKTFDIVLILTLVYSTVDVTITIYVPVATEITKAVHSHNMPIAYVLVVQEMIMIFAPAVTAGLLSSQVESLRLVLFDRLIQDQINAVDIKRFISYIEARPLRFKVWTVVPLDWSLPVIVVNISVTYLIVMIQFTHKN